MSYLNIFFLIFPIYFLFTNHYFKDFIYFIKLLFDLLLLGCFSFLHLKVPKFIVNAIYKDINNNGFFAIKFIQWILTRSKLLYDNNDLPDWIYLFNNFYENCDIHSFHYTKNIIETTMDKNINEIFEYIDHKPIASGSIAQVYKCKYKNNNKECVLKIKHPNLYKKSFFIIKFCKFIEFLLKSNIGFIFNGLFPPLDLELFFQSLRDQTNLNIEANNMKKMKSQYKNDQSLIIIPECYYHNEHFIIMSFEDGIAFHSINESDYVKYKIILILSLFMRSMTLIYGTVHCDLHCANWKVRKIGPQDYQLVIYDYGIIIHPPLDFMKKFMIAWETCDYNKISDSLDAFIKFHPLSETKLKIQKEILKKELQKWTIKPLQMNTILIILCRWACRNGIIFNGNFLNQAIVLTLVEDEMRKAGITGANKNEDIVETSQCMLKVEYLNYISFCRTKNVFHELADYLDSVLSDQNTEFSELFHKLEYKLNVNGLKSIVSKSNVPAQRKPITTLEL